MTYNIHPLFVHFPIALLLLYSAIKILPLHKWLPSVAWKHLERVLLITGVLSAMVASSTGEVAEHLVRPDHDLVEMHALFASASTWFYGLLLVGEVLYFINPKITTRFGSSYVTKLLGFVQKVLTNRAVTLILAILGLLAISVTGLLGGVMVYGVTADPLTSIVVDILGISY